MQILMLAPQFRPIIGGYERAAERLSVALVKCGHEVTVVTERRNSNWPAEENAEGVKIRRLWCFYRPRFHMLTSLISLMLFLLFHGRRFQVWHVHQYGMHAAVAVLLSKVLGRPVVLKLTNSGAHGVAQAIAALPLKGIVKYLLLKVDAVVALSQETSLEAVSFGISRKKVHVLGNGIDVENFKPVAEIDKGSCRNMLDIDASGVVLCVGRLSEGKNTDGLLRAWKIAQPNMPAGWKLVIVGDGPLLSKLKSYIESESLVESVLLSGYQSDISAWMGAADIYVIASHFEGLSNAMLEAMASGLPIVSTRVSGSTETVLETGAGKVVNIGDMDQLAEEITALTKDRCLRIKMGHCGRLTTEKTYSIERVAASHVALYSELVKPKTLIGSK